MPKTEEETYGFIELYFPEQEEHMFATQAEQWSAWERFIDLLCMISLVMKDHRQPERLMRIGCLLEDEELVKSLEPREEAVFPCRARVRMIYKELKKRGEGKDMPLSGLLSLDLKPVEVMAFLLAACADRSRKYERIFGVLQEEKTMMAKPTAGLVHDLCALFLDEEENSPGILLDEDRFLNRFLLKTEKDNPRMSRLSRPITLKKPVLSLLYGNTDILGAMSSCAEILCQGDTRQIICHQELLSRLLEVFTRMTFLKEEGLIRFKGAAGAGKKYLAQALGDALGMEVLCIYGKRLLTRSPEERMEILEEAVLKTVLAQQILYLDLCGLCQEESGQIKQILVYLQDYTGRFLVGMDAAWMEEIKTQGISYRICVDTPDADAQKRFWTYFMEESRMQFEEDINLDQLVSLYDLTPQKIKDTLTCLMLSSPLRKCPNEKEYRFLISKKELEQEIQNQCSAVFGCYATRLESPFVWEDLKLSKESQKLLQQACDRVRYRSVVHHTFGFGKKLSYGRGLSIVLYGPPGTGKTMTAQVLAKELGLSIYRIDLSQIGSKYIGETEKNLGAIFDAARFSNAVLFFDEADALFTKRTEVSNSNDRHANAETAYLLQKIEEYSGVSILATNVMQNFDNAFKRRMTFMIPIEQPNEEERLLLWEHAFPKEAPLAKDISFALYAQVAELTGSGIKSAALSAAYRAAAEHRAIEHKDLVEAIDFEYRKIGRTGISQELYTARYRNQ